MKKLKIALSIALLMTGLIAKAQKIGLLMDAYETDRWYMDQKLFTDRVKELGGECVVEAAYGDPDEQIRLGKKMIADGVKVLVIVPTNAIGEAVLLRVVVADCMRCPRVNGPAAAFIRSFDLCCAARNAANAVADCVI